MINLESAEPEELYDAWSGVKLLRACLGFEGNLTKEREEMLNQQEKELINALHQKGWGDGKGGGVFPLSWELHGPRSYQRKSL